MKRRQFVRMSLQAGAASVILGQGFNLLAAPPEEPEAVWISGGEPEGLLAAALQVYGGMQRFISRGDVVVVKPNIGWDRAPQFAANTNPDLVAAVIKACFDAGASKVKVFERTCNNAQRCYRSSMLEAVAKEHGADVEQVRDFRFREIALPGGEILKNWPVYKDYLEADKIINIPIAKHHSMALVSGGLKNLMGVMGGNRGEIHNHFNKKLIDIGSNILPTLTIIDAYRILLRNGPVGGNLGDVKLTKTLIMSRCTVTADTLALRLFNRQIEDIPYLREAYARGLNKFDPANLKLQRVDLS
jgi:uncharacterized protein (DUF362 family)